MSALVAQRWTQRRTVFVRPDGATLRPHEWEVVALASDTTARAFVEAHHYSGSYPAARRRFGLYHRADLVGVAVFSQPMRDEVLRPFSPDAAMELGRFVLLDRVPYNAESWMARQCFDALAREGLDGVVSFSDPEPRMDAAGVETFRGHVGTIYQASGAVYAGRNRRQVLRLLPDGSVFSARAAAKVRQRERGWRYAAEQLVAAGAPSPTGDLAAWLPVALAQVTRPMSHGGNHRYLVPLSGAAKRCLAGCGLSYPKAHAAGAHVADMAGAIGGPR